MPLVDDIVAGAAEESKQQLQEALLELLKQNPDILDSVTKSSLNDGQTKINDCVPGNVCKPIPCSFTLINMLESNPAF